MSPTSGTVLLVQSPTQLSRAAESDLALAGFELVGVLDSRKLLEAARGRTVAALLLTRGVTRGVWERWRREPNLRRVPVLLLAPRGPQQVLFTWPIGAFVRGDGYLSAADLKRRGAAADAVRAVIARGAGVTPSGREKFGEALWFVGSVVYQLAFLLALVAVVELAMRRDPAAIVMSVLLTEAGKLLMDVGGGIGLGQRLGLRWRNWVSIILVCFAARFLFVHSM